MNGDLKLKIDMEFIKRTDDNWYWNVNKVLEGYSVRDVHWEDCPMFCRLTIAFKDGLIRIDQYNKEDGSNQKGTLHTMVIDRDYMKIIKEMMKADRKVKTWEDLLKQHGIIDVIGFDGDVQ